MNSRIVMLTVINQKWKVVSIIQIYIIFYVMLDYGYQFSNYIK